MIEPTVARAKNNNTVLESVLIVYTQGVRALRALASLLRSGHGVAAFAIWRSLHEAVVVGHTICKGESETAQRFLDHQRIGELRLARAYQHSGIILDEAEIAYISNLRSEADRLALRYGKGFKSNYGWASHALGKGPKHEPSLRELEQYAAIPAQPLDTHNANLRVHTGANALNETSLYTEDWRMDTTGASSHGLLEPALQACSSTGALVSLLLEYSDTNLADAIKRLTRSAISVVHAAVEEMAEQSPHAS